MPAKPASDIPSDSEAHVPWESIDEAEEQCDPDDSETLSESSGDPSGGRGSRRAGDFEQASPPREGEAPAEPNLSNGRASAKPGAKRSGAPDPARGASADQAPTTGGGWTLPLLCAGIALIACCALIPQADTNRRLAYEKQELARDLETVEKQIAVNDEFLKQVGDDPTLAERLAQRQMKVIPQGTKVLELPHDKAATSMSPFQLVNVPPPPPLPPYKPVGGTIARLCYDAHSRLYLIGVALCMIATGLVMGSAPER